MACTAVYLRRNHVFITRGSVAAAVLPRRQRIANNISIYSLTVLNFPVSVMIRILLFDLIKCV